jgi:NADH-quinone oxidoreductase subunit A
LNTPAAHSAEIWPLVAYFLLVIALIAGVLILSHLTGERHRAGAANEPFEGGIVTVGRARLRLSAKFYLIAMFFVIFDVEAVFLFAWAVAFRELGWAGYIEVAVFISVLVAALAYLWRLGALDWGSSGSRAHRQKGGQRCDGP